MNSRVLHLDAAYHSFCARSLIGLKAESRSDSDDKTQAAYEGILTSRVDLAYGRRPAFL